MQYKIFILFVIVGLQSFMFRVVPQLLNSFILKAVIGNYTDRYADVNT